MKIELWKYLNPFRWASLMFFFAYKIWKIPADAWDSFNSTTYNSLTAISDRVYEFEFEFFKNLPISERVGKIIVVILLIILVAIWVGWIKREILS